MVDNGLLPIHKIIYDMLLQKHTDRIRRYEFTGIVLNIRFNEEMINKLLEDIKTLLLHQGFSIRQVDRICSEITYRSRYSTEDAHEIEKTLRSKGYLEYTQDGWLHIKR